MGSRRDYAITLGLAIPGRGRLSRAANEACDKAEAKGMEFDIPLSAAVKTPRLRKAAPAPGAKGADKFVKTTVVAPAEEPEWANVQNEVYSSSQMWRSETGQIVNGRAVCTQCGFSLQWHLCKNPTAIVSPGVLESLVLV